MALAGGLFGILFLLSLIASFVCWIIILIDAFQDEVWKGLVFFFCTLYSVYYAIFEFDHENKWWIVGGYLSTLLIAVVLKLLVLSSPTAGLQP